MNGAAVEIDSRVPVLLRKRRKWWVASCPVVIPMYAEIEVDISKANMGAARMSRQRDFELLDSC